MHIQGYRDERGSFLRLANNFLAIISLVGGGGEGGGKGVGFNYSSSKELLLE